MPQAIDYLGPTVYVVATVLKPSQQPQNFQSIMNDIWAMAFGGAVKAEVILSKVDSAVGHAIPVTLLTYPDGSMDLYRPQGNQFRDHVAEAKALLNTRGLRTGAVELMMPTGGYMPVWKKQVAKVHEGCAPGEDHRTLSLAPYPGYDALLRLVDAPAGAAKAAGVQLVR